MTRGLPVPSDLTVPYWEAAQRQVLLLQRCDRCHRFITYPRYLCLTCGSTDSSWVQSAGTGAVYSFTVMHTAPSADFQELVPYVIALIDLDEGVRMMSNLMIDGDEHPVIGQRVQLSWLSVEGGFLPVFTPTSDPR